MADRPEKLMLPIRGTGRSRRAIKPAIVAPPVFTDRVQLGYANNETSWDFASQGFRGLAHEWLDQNGVRQEGGLWLDATGIERGGNHFVTIPLSAGATSFNANISAIQGDLIIKGIAPGTATGPWTVTIDGIPVTAWYIADGTFQNFQLGTGVSGNSLSSVAIFVKNPNRGTTLATTWTIPLPGIRNVSINHAIGPLINEYPMGANVGSAPDLFDYEPTSEADWNAFWTNIGVDVFANGATFGVAPNGFKYIRFKIPQGVRNGLSAWKRFLPARESVHTQCVFYLENSVWEGIHPNDACKTAFAPTQECPWHGNDTWDWSLRGHHGGKSLANPYIFSFEDYSEVVTSGPAITMLDRNVVIRCERYILLDVFVQMNTMVPNVSYEADGILRIKINKNLVFEKTDIAWRNETQTPGNTIESSIEAAEANFYQGGNDPGTEPVGDMWYRLGRLRASSTEISIPDEFLPSGASWPDWRNAIVTDDLQDIPGTNPSSVMPNNAGPLHWNGWAIFPDGRVGAAALGGHNSTFTSPGGDALNGQNMTVGLDLRDNAPTWVVKHPGTSALNAIDWTPTYVHPDGDTRGPIDDWHFTTKLGAPRKHYDADAGDVPIRCSYQSYSTQRGILGTFCNDGNDRIMLVGMRSPRSRLGGTHSTKQVDGFRWNDTTWDTPIGDFVAYPFAGNGTQWGDIPAGDAGSSEPVCCDDPRTGKIYWARQYGIFIMDPAASTNQWFVAAAGTPGSFYSWSGQTWNGWGDFAMCIDPVRNRLFCIRQFSADPHATRVEYFPLNGGTLVLTPAITNGLGQNGISIGTRTKIVNNDNGLAYDADNDRYMLVLSSSAGASQTDQWYSIDPDSRVATLVHQSAAGAGCPGRVMSSFAWLQALGGFVLGRGTSVPLQFMRTRTAP